MPFCNRTEHICLYPCIKDKQEKQKVVMKKKNRSHPEFITYSTKKLQTGNETIVNGNRKKI